MNYFGDRYFCFGNKDDIDEVIVLMCEVIKNMDIFDDFLGCYNNLVVLLGDWCFGEGDCGDLVEVV